MRVSIENTGPIGRRMSVAVPADELEQELSQRLKTLTRSVKLPGFRPGKVPRHLVEARYGGQLLHEVAGEMINSSYQQALGQEELVPAGRLAIENTRIERGVDLEYVAVFDVFPEIPNPHIQGRPIVKPVVTIGEPDIDRTIERIRKGRAQFEASEQPAAEGDRVTMDFSGTIDGVPFDGGSGEDYPFVMGAGMLLAQFEEALAATRPGEQRTFDVQFPDDYTNAALSAKTAAFEVTVKAVERPVLPELDEDFIKSFGVDDGQMDSLRREVRGNLQRELDGRLRTYLRHQALQALQEANPLSLPQSLVDDEIDRMIEGRRTAMANRGLAVEAGPADRGVFEQEAQRRVALALIVREIVTSSNIKPDPAEVRKRVEEMAGGYEQPEQFVQWYYQDRDRLAQVESLVVEEQVVDTLLKEADVRSEDMSLDELMDKTTAAGGG